MNDPVPHINVARFVGKEIGVPLATMLELPDEVLNAMSRYIYRGQRRQKAAILKRVIPVTRQFIDRYRSTLRDLE